MILVILGLEISSGHGRAIRSGLAVILGALGNSRNGCGLWFWRFERLWCRHTPPRTSYEWGNHAIFMNAVETGTIHEKESLEMVPTILDAW